MTTVVDQVITIFDAVWKGEGAAKSAALSLDKYGKMSRQAALSHFKLATQTDSARANFRNWMAEVDVGKTSVGDLDNKFKGYTETIARQEGQLATLAQSQQTLGGRMKNVAASLGMVTVAAGATAIALRTVFEGTKKIYNLAKEGAGVAQLSASFDLLNKKIMHTPNLLEDMTRATGGTLSKVSAMQGFMTLVAGSTEELTQAFAKAAPQLAEIAKAANKLNPTLGDTNFMFESIGRGIKRLEPRLLDNLGLNVRMKSANDRWAEANNRTVESMTAEEKVMAALNETLRVGANLIEQVGGNVDSLVDPYLRLTAAWQDYTNAVKENIALQMFGTKNLEDGVRQLEMNIRLDQAWNEVIEKGLLTRKDRVRWDKAIRQGRVTEQDELDQLTFLLDKYEQKQIDAKDAAIGWRDALDSVFARAGDEDAGRGLDAVAKAAKRGAYDFAAVIGSSIWDKQPALDELREQFKDAQDWAKEASNAIQEQIKHIRELDAATGDYAMAAINADKESSLFNQTIDEIGEGYVTVGGRTKEQNELLEDMQKAYEKTQKNIRDYSVGIKGVGQEQETVNKRMEGYNEQLAILAPQIEKLKGIQGDVVKVNREATW
ncbi:MAG: hypothetical protein GWN94_22580, partial [Phycisphaerae bacterium]|nr:hypothetical protein [Phycisphaerae bacterium]NIS53849.1 hypothetical protein [Phycisphaerae bacterium]